MKQAGAAIRAISSNSFLKRSLARNQNVEEESWLVVSGEPSEDIAIQTSVTETEKTQMEIFETTEEETSFEVPGTSDAQSASERLHNEETLSYVLGSIIRRLECRGCSQGIGIVLDAESATGFTAEMLFEGGHLFSPNNTLLQTCIPIVRPALQFFEANLSVHQITQRAIAKFRFTNDIGFCCSAHSDLFLKFFLQLLLRVLCKDMNSAVSKSRDSKRRKLNIR